MFIHKVLFEIKSKEVPFYHRDCRMWANYARKAPGFIAYYTLKRRGYKKQFASVYMWKGRVMHDRFMHKFHDWLVAKSKARVKVLGYYNFDVLSHTKEEE
ncbi:MAG: hypothetical protein WC510_05780 [Candidatus Omnitrophota bacterium]